MNIVRRESQTPAAAPAYTEWNPLRMVRDLMRWDPFQEMAPMFPNQGQAGFFMPDVDIKETSDAYVFKADLPGIKEKDVEVSFTGNRMTLSGKREEERREERTNYYAFERSYGSFNRSFTLPGGTNAELAKADLKDGVLTVTVPKKPEAQARKIPVGSPPEKKAS
jgi:HSP20 family protein